MNVVQIIRKARLGCDAILPSGAVSTMWGDDEMVDLVEEAYEELMLRFRMARKKWGLRTVSSSDASFTQDGETYVPASNLIVGAAAGNAPPKLLLPPDFGEMVSITPNLGAAPSSVNMTIRFLPAQMESFHFIDAMLGSYNTTGSSVIPSTPDGLTFYWDIIDLRTLFIIPPTTQTFPISLNYISMRRPLYYTAVGTVTVTNGSAIVTGTGTAFQSSNIFSESSGNACDLILGPFTSPSPFIQDPAIKLAFDYPRIASIDSDTQFTLVQPATAAMAGAGQQYIIAMAPALSRQYHRFVARLTTAYMLTKVSPDLTDKVEKRVMEKFTEFIQPTAHVRQSQESVVTEDAEEFGVTSEW